ncbi:MAG: hypothetical protein K5678_02135 [Acetatifactor sp.]|jgi:hypothetical protein|nr:hypothetical protein [Acetatifactor sp.]
MKKKIKKVLTGICLAVALLLCGIPAPKVSAAYDTCLDVRDYGYHRYTMRTYEYDQHRSIEIETKESLFFYNGHFYATREYDVFHEWKRVEICICGLGKESPFYKISTRKETVMLY